jgi:ribosomal protein S21
LRVTNAVVVARGQSESVDSLIRRFRKACNQENVSKAFKEHLFHMSKSERKRYKEAIALRRLRKVQRRREEAQTFSENKIQ